MQEKRVESIREVDFSGLKVPFVAVYGHPDDFPDKYVARIYELDRATDTIMVKETLEEIEMDIKEHTAMTFIPRGTADVPSLVGVWMWEGSSMRSAKEYKAIREEIYRFIGAYITKHVYAPSNKEIAEAVGISGTTVHRHLIDMIDEGILETDAEPGTQRAIRIRNTQVVKRRKKSE